MRNPRREIGWDFVLSRRVVSIRYAASRIDAKRKAASGYRIPAGIPARQVLHLYGKQHDLELADLRFALPAAFAKGGGALA